MFGARVSRGMIRIDARLALRIGSFRFGARNASVDDGFRHASAQASVLLAFKQVVAHVGRVLALRCGAVGRARARLMPMLNLLRLGRVLDPGRAQRVGTDLRLLRVDGDRARRAAGHTDHHGRNPVRPALAQPAAGNGAAGACTGRSLTAHGVTRLRAPVDGSRAARAGRVRTGCRVHAGCRVRTLHRTRGTRGHAGGSRSPSSVHRRSPRRA